MAGAEMIVPPGSPVKAPLLTMVPLLARLPLVSRVDPLWDGQGFALVNGEVILQSHIAVDGTFRAVKDDAAAFTISFWSRYTCHGCIDTWYGFNQCTVTNRQGSTWVRSRERRIENSIGAFGGQTSTVDCKRKFSTTPALYADSVTTLFFRICYNRSIVDCQRGIA